MVSKKKIFIPRLLFSLSLACIAGDGYANGIIDDISPVVMQDGKTLSGLVLDETGPVIGASVIVKGTTVGTVTDMDGHFSIPGVKKGDVIYEAKGGFGITGHIAIVDGIYTRSDGTKYIRLIEAISNSYGGVTRSILDDTRVDEKGVTILRVSGATESIKNAAVSFCRGEVGSSYNLDLAKDTSASETDWYCSELVWAAYKNQGIDIEVGGSHGEPGVTPHDIVNSSKTYAVAYSTN